MSGMNVKETVSKTILVYYSLKIVFSCFGSWMSALRLKGSSLAEDDVVFFQTLLPSQAEKDYRSE